MSAAQIVKKYQLTDYLNGQTQNIMKGVIEIFNNDEFILDFDGVVFQNNDTSIKGVEIIKVKIDWGDNTSDTYIKKLYSASSSLGIFNQQNWKIVKHTFNVDKLNVYLTDDVRVLPKITVTFYSSFDDRVTIYIPYKLVYKSFYDLGIQYNLKSANVSNQNRSSFVLNDKRDDSLIVVAVKNWKKIYGQDQIVYISDDYISQDYADEFVNEESIIWNWSDVPIIALNVDIVEQVEEKENEPNRKYTCFSCSFDQKNVNIESNWIPKCYKVCTPDDIEISNIQRNQNQRSFKIYNVVNGVKENLETGIYKIYMQVTGINGVSGVSQYVYKKTSESIQPDKLEVPQSSPITQYKNDDKVIIFRYCLPQDTCPNHLQYAKLHLTTSKYDDSNSGIDIKQSDNFRDLQPLVITYDLNFENPKTEEVIITDQNGKEDKISETYYQTKIPFREIPNGEYTFSVEVKEICKSSEDMYQTNVYQGSEVTEIPSVTLLYTSVGNVSQPMVSINDKKMETSWTITNEPERGDVLYRVSQMSDKNPEKVISYIVDKKIPFDDYKPTNDGHFSQKISCESIPNGIYKVEIGHIIPMNKYVGQRQDIRMYKEVIDGVQNNYYTYNYPVPKLTISNFVSYLKKIGNRFYPYMKGLINLSEDNSERGLEILCGTKSFTPNINGSFDLPISQFGLETNYAYEADQNGIIDLKSSDISAVGYDSKDSIYKRKEQYPRRYCITRTPLTLYEDFLNIDTTNENISSSKVYLDKDNIQRNGYELINTSVYNIKKAYKWTSPNNTNDVYYSYGEDANYYSVDDTKLKILFKGCRYTDIDTNAKIFRYQPCVQTLDDTWTATKLTDVKSFLKEKNIEVSSNYQSAYDYMRIDVKGILSPSEILDTNDAICKLYDQQGKEVYQSNIRSNFSVSIPYRKPGKYTMTIDYHSANTDNVSNSIYKCGWDVNDTSCDQIIPQLDVKLKSKQAMDYSYQVKNVAPYKYFSVKCNIHYKDMTNLAINYILVKMTIVTEQDEKGNQTQVVKYIPQDAKKCSIPMSTGQLQLNQAFSAGDYIMYWFTFTDKNNSYDLIEWEGAEGRHTADNITYYF